LLHNSALAVLKKARKTPRLSAAWMACTLSAVAVSYPLEELVVDKFSEDCIFLSLKLSIASFSVSNT